MLKVDRDSSNSTAEESLGETIKALEELLPTSEEKLGKEENWISFNDSETRASKVGCEKDMMIGDTNVDGIGISGGAWVVVVIKSFDGCKIESEAVISCNNAMSDER